MSCKQCPSKVQLSMFAHCATYICIYDNSIHLSKTIFELGIRNPKITFYLQEIVLERFFHITEEYFQTFASGDQ